MPSPSSTSWIATDGLLYDTVYNPLAKQMCFLNPNWVTAACFAMLGPLAYGLYARWPLWLLLALMFVRQSLDCMDGAIARACKTTSWLGAFLDSLEDTVSIAVFGAVALWTLSKKRLPEWLFNALVVTWIAGIVNFGFYTYKTYHGEKFENNWFSQLVHDNTVIITLGFTWLLHALRQ
jgi:phosphatidylglycerophosphate synthase